MIMSVADRAVNCIFDVYVHSVSTPAVRPDGIAYPVNILKAGHDLYTLP